MLEFLPMGLNWVPMMLFGDKLPDWILPLEIRGRFLPNIPEFFGLTCYKSTPSPEIFRDAYLSKQKPEPSAFACWF
jgi:hypothetical protein